MVELIGLDVWSIGWVVWLVWLVGWMFDWLGDLVSLAGLLDRVVELLDG